MNQTPEVTLYATSDSRHLPYLLTGLIALAEGGEVELRVRPRPPRFRDRLKVNGAQMQRVSRPYPYSYLLHVRDPSTGRFVRAAVDLQDWKDLFSHGDLTACDVLFKRSYDPQIASAISSRFGIAVVPAGMTHSARVEGGRYSKALALARILGKVETLLTNPGLGPAWIRETLTKRRGCGEARKAGDGGSSAHEDLKEFAFFQIRCHGDGGWREAEELNKARARLIRFMRNSLGSRFQGGMYFDGPPRREFADCLSPLSSSPQAYLKLVAQAAVVLSTNGFGGSFPWKLCEYLSLGKCIVTESLAFPLPTPLRSGKEAVFFDNHPECAKTTAELLGTPLVRERMGGAAREYYRNHVAPAAAARRYVATALSTKRN